MGVDTLQIAQRSTPTLPLPGGGYNAVPWSLYRVHRGEEQGIPAVCYHNAEVEYFRRHARERRMLDLTCRDPNSIEMGFDPASSSRVVLPFTYQPEHIERRASDYGMEPSNFPLCFLPRRG